MATLELSKRLILAGGFAVAVAVAPAIAVFAGPSASVLACPGGEEEDQFTGVCVPHTVPNSGASFSGIAGNPDLPSIDGVPCTGHNSGQCIGLAEEEQAMGPQPVPRSTVSSSP
ncbi:MAG TPA: intersectin-EH binding protein Ibp1 [Mycobacterium sp.]|nr:intersectin-EH binding protein Ibp1 [Mycobacterium sp.]